MPFATKPSLQESTHTEKDEVKSKPLPDDFFSRNGLSRLTKEKCHAYACLRFPSAVIRPASSQGYCSYTLAVSTDHILQFRPERFKLDMDICRDAKDVFGPLAPTTRYLGVMVGVSDEAPMCHNVGLHIYLQNRLPGISLASFREHSPAAYSDKHQIRLVEDMAHVFAMGYRQRRPLKRSKATEAVVKRKVGNSLKRRLEMLQSLPGEQLARHVADVKRSVQAIEELPWCLTHGDLVPSNIMVDADTGCLTGLVDWAEGEWLPLGIGLYGLEEVLGHEEADPGGGFQYFDNHEELRHAFWNRLLQLCGDSSELGTKLRLQEVQLARKLGIMLWRGIAFDDGRIDRVVQAGRDDAELHKLHLFLNTPSGLGEKVLGLEGSWASIPRVLSFAPWAWMWMWICHTFDGFAVSRGTL